MAPSAVSVESSIEHAVNYLTKTSNGSISTLKRKVLTSQVISRTGRTDTKQPFDIISSTIHFRKPEHQFWWDKTGSQLAELLKYAGYSKAEQYNELLFYAIQIVPELDPTPDANGHLRWKSPQAPDGTPLDLSWEWGLEGKGVVRTFFEPIGPMAGTEADPFNRNETNAWIKHLDSQGWVSGLDLEWYNHFTATVLPSELGRVKMPKKLHFELAPVAGTFVTRDIDRNGPIIKLYIFPGLRAQELGVSNLDVVVRAIRSLPAEQYASLRCEPMLEYLHEVAAKWKMDVGIFSFDLVSPQQSRIKIYTRAPNTSVEYLMDALMLGGRYDMAMYTAEAIADVKDLWHIFIGDAPAELPSEVERAGPGFYFTVKAGKPTTPMVYISPASFCKNDAKVLRRLRRPFATRKNADKMLPQMENYVEMLRKIYGEEFLESTGDIYFYVSCALAKV
ncbi:aromatic prenyltransferase [Karstenula rhodostoma CBS 690.94]|uniref:Aromatic prenyltransferase n=1 Tax=Karstenula rhodostoma CBS 690.94 TaxID=1392251 RepID=A0A9P4P8F7_9PLEO|nr:aromatic prenyltransferase [Karstenula rhodostoma CBS 690.94]